jgi:cyanophycinase-like exopeptidase
MAQRSISSRLKTCAARLLAHIAVAHLIVLFVTVSSAAHAGKPFDYFALGDPERPVDITARTRAASVALVGGGYDVAEPFRWLIRQAGVDPAACRGSVCTPTSGGRFVIIRASGTDAYNPYIYSRLGTVDPTTPMNYEMVGGIDLGLSAVETVIIPSQAAANDPFVNSVVARADVIWVAGGDQANYHNFWGPGTYLNRTLNAKVSGTAISFDIIENDGSRSTIMTGSNPTPIGGTSAGTAILGQFSFAALRGTVTSQQALSDPFNRYMTLVPDPTAATLVDSLLTVPGLAGVVADDHLETRDRMGRLIAFLARITSEACHGPSALPLSRSRAIGLDEETALLITRGSAQIATNPIYQKAQANIAHPNSAYLVRFTESVSGTRCEPGLPLTTYSVGLQRMTPSMPNARTLTTACSVHPRAVASCPNQNVSYIDPNVTFDLTSWSGSGVDMSIRFVENGVISGSPY